MSNFAVKRPFFLILMDFADFCFFSLAENFEIMSVLLKNHSQNFFQALIIKDMNPPMYRSLTDMVDDNLMLDLSQYFRLGKII